MVAAHQQWHAPCSQHIAHARKHDLIPGGDLGEVAKTVDRFVLGIGGARQVAMVQDIQAARTQGLRETGNAQRVRPYAGA